MVQFNGRYGCTFCYAEGCILEGPSNQTKYPVGDYKRRTDASIRQDALCAMREESDQNGHCNGVKGPCALGRVEGFNLGVGQIVEKLHAVDEGALKQHCSGLFERTDSPCYIGDPATKRVIDDIISKIQLPSRISRSPRSIQDLKQWKANEYRNWGYYCLPCLENILPSKYLNHLALLCEANYIINKDSITHEEIDRCDLLLKEYCEKYEEYFGIKLMTYNMHLLTHISETVKNWGPSWATNGYIFEAMNRRIVENITSPSGRQLQIYSRFILNKFIQNCCYNTEISADTREYISDLFSIPYNVGGTPNGEVRFCGIGGTERREPSSKEKEALASAGYDCENLKDYKKAKINGIEYRRKDFRSNTKFSNSTVLTDNVGFGEITSIIEFGPDEDSVKGLLIQPFEVKGSFAQTTFIKTVVQTENIVFVPIAAVRKPAFQIHSNNKIRVVALPNVWETD